MSREIDQLVLTEAAKNYASRWNARDIMGNAGNWVDGPNWVLQDFYGFIFKDEFEFVLEAFKNKLGADDVSAFEAAATGAFKPRAEKHFHRLLADKLAVDPDGGHLTGKIGTTKLNGRLIGTQIIEVEAPWSIARRRHYGLAKTVENRELVHKIIPLVWPIYAGEDEERKRDAGVADPIPSKLHLITGQFLGDEGGALNTVISNESALLGANALVDNLDEGSAGATIQGRTGSQPTDPDTAVSGTNLFTLTCSATAFGAASDAGPGALKTANSITDDTSADATGTLGYCRASSSNSAGTPLDDHIDGEAGTSSADWIFNTLAIVSGSTVSASGWTITLPET